MVTYIDSSALVKRYISEPDSKFASSLISADPVLVTSWLTFVEVRKAVSRAFEGPDLAAAHRALTEDFDKMAVVAPDVLTWQAAADIVDALKIRSLDAIHLACAQRLRVKNLRFITFDLRQAIAARSLGFNVEGG